MCSRKSKEAAGTVRFRLRGSSATSIGMDHHHERAISRRGQNANAHSINNRNFSKKQENYRKGKEGGVEVVEQQFLAMLLERRNGPAEHTNKLI